MLICLHRRWDIPGLQLAFEENTSCDFFILFKTELKCFQGDRQHVSNKFACYKSCPLALENLYKSILNM